MGDELVITRGRSKTRTLVSSALLGVAGAVAGCGDGAGAAGPTDSAAEVSAPDSLEDSADTSRVAPEIAAEGSIDASRTEAGADAAGGDSQAPADAGRDTTVPDAPEDAPGDAFGEADAGGADAVVSDSPADAPGADVHGSDAADAGPVWVVRVSVDSANRPAAANSDNSSPSGDGRFVAFRNYADNLVAGDTNLAPDIFVRDVTLRTTVRVSVTSTGEQGNADSTEPVISADGRYVALSTLSSNLCPSPTVSHYDIVLHDMKTGATSCLSLDPNGNGDTGESTFPSISDDGGLVAFESTSNTLIANQFISEGNVYVRDVAGGVTRIVSVDSAGNVGDLTSRTTALSGDGRFVAFVSNSTNLVPGDTNGAYDVFVHDLVSGATERVSISTAGAQSDGDCDYPFLSRDGSIVVFSCYATTLVTGGTQPAYDLYVRDRTAGTTAFVGPPVGASNSVGGTYVLPAVSADGRYVAFYTSDPNVLPGSNSSNDDVYVVDRTTLEVRRVSRTPLGVGSTGSSVLPSISADGQRITYASSGTDLVPEDGQGFTHLYETTRP
jgi:Tol biopolymer transport system component